ALTVIMTVIMSPCIFMYSLIVERQMSGFAALRTSIRAILGNFWGVIGLLILVNLLGTLGSLVCGVGLYLVLPITFAAYTVAYRQVFPEVARVVIPVEAEPAEQDAELAGPASTAIQTE